MVFDLKTWADGELITAADLNRVEQAVDAVDEQMGSKVDATDPRLTDARPPTTHTHPWADVTGKPTSFPPATHNHDDRYPRITLPDASSSVPNVLALPDGDYGERFGVNVTTARGYPVAGVAGWLRLRSSSSGSMRWATFRLFDRPGVVWENRYTGGAWVGWATISDLTVPARVTALEQDTGWRNIQSFAPGYIGGKIVCRRVGKVVEIAAEGLQITGTGSLDFTNPLGAGWSPARPIYTKGTDYWGDSVTSTVRLWTDARIRGIFGATVNPKIHFQFIYTTTDAWPTTLPGAPA